MKVLHIIASVDPMGGGPIEGILRQNDVLKQQVTFEIATMDAPTSDFVKSCPMTVHALGPVAGPRKKWNLLAHYGFAPRMVPWLKAHIADYDAVIVNGLWNYSTWAAARTLPGSPIPYFVFTHGMMDPWFKRAYPLKHISKQLFWWVNEGPLLKQSRSVLFTCEEERLLAQHVFQGYQSYPEKVVGFGTVEPPPETPEQRDAFFRAVPGLNGRRYLLFLSRIHEKKGCDLLVDAFAAYAADAPDLDLVIAGPDHAGLQQQLADRATGLGVSQRIHWPGMLQGDAKWGAFRGADAFVLPSHQENFGIVVAEAMACGIPVLTTNKVNIWREVASAEGGLIEADTPEGIRRLLGKWLEMGNDSRIVMAQNARVGFEQHFKMDQAANTMLAHIRANLQPSHADTELPVPALHR